MKTLKTLAPTLLLLLAIHFCIGEDKTRGMTGYGIDDAMAEIGLLKTMLYHVDSRVKNMEKLLLNMDKGIKSTLKGVGTSLRGHNA